MAASDPNIVWVGTGSACPRGNVSAGDGIYKSTDGGDSWRHMGLDKAGQIGRVVVHPTDPDIVYVAVLGNIFGSSGTPRSGPMAAVVNAVRIAARWARTRRSAR